MITLDASTPIDIRNILLATDFDPISEAALRYSLVIARRYKAKMYLLHVVPPETFQFLSGDARQRSLDEAWRDAHRHMTDLLIAGHLEGVEHQVMVEQGEIWDVISKKIGELHANMLVLGTHGRTRIGKLLLGSVAETIFRQAPCPVLTAGPKTTLEAVAAGPRKILFCTGFSGHSLRAGNYALALAQAREAELILMHVIQQTAETPQRREEMRQEATEKLRGLIPESAQLSVPPKFIVDFGNSAERILAVAGEHNPNLIVLGVRQPEGFARRLKWATAYEVVANAPCPVLTVRTSVPV